MAKLGFRAIRGRRNLIDIGAVRRELSDTMDNVVKPLAVGKHEEIVQSWQHKPSFGARKTITADGIRLYVFPTGEHAKIWLFVDQGTKPHKIRPKVAARLAFRTGYRAKTAPGAKVVGGGGASGPLVFAKEVDHPGTEAREFSKAIAEDILPEFRKEIENAFRRIQRRLSD